LHEEGWRNDAFVADEAVWVDQCAADDAGKYDAEATSEHLREISNDGATSHRTQIGYDLGDGDCISRKAILISEHRWVQILASVRPCNPVSKCVLDLKIW
jgi:hypothetical protein